MQFLKIRRKTQVSKFTSMEKKKKKKVDWKQNRQLYLLSAFCCLMLYNWHLKVSPWRTLKLLLCEMKWETIVLVPLPHLTGVH